MARLLVFLALLTALALPAWAQDERDDRTILESFLENNLSSDNMEVTVIGFAGALSRQATMREMTFADDDGVWLRLSDVTLSWDRAALLQRRLEVRELTAAEIELTRLPAGKSGPSAQASDFTLPELPVAVHIDRLSAERLALGPAVLGTAAEMTLEGAGNLEGGEGRASVTLLRTDGQSGRFVLEGSYANESRVLALDLSVSEGQGGIVAGLLGMPGAPALDLTVKGEDPLEDYRADVLLATDGVNRLAGRVRLASHRIEGDGETAQAATESRLVASLSGDLRPLFAPEYRDFFGGEAVLHLEGTRFADRTTRIGDLFLKTDALHLRGNALLNERAWPERAHLEGRIAHDDGAPVLLPLAGDPTRIDGAELSFDYDSARGQGWTGAAAFAGLTREGLTLDRLTLNGEGTLAPDAEKAAFGGDLTLAAAGIALGDAALAAAVGDRLSGDLHFAKVAGAPFDLSELALRGADYGLSGAVTLRTEAAQLGLVAALDLTLAADRLARLAALAGQAGLAGAATLDITGDMTVPNGPFDLEIEGETRDLSLGIERFDPLWAGENRLSIGIDRTQERTALRHLTLTGRGFEGSASGTLRPDGSNLVAEIALPDAVLLDDKLAGRLGLDARAVLVGDAWTVSAQAEGPGGLVADIGGTGRMVRGAVGPVETTLTAAAGDLAPWSGLAGRPLSGGIDLALAARGDLRTEALKLSGTARGLNLGLGLGDIDRLLAGASDLSFVLGRAADGTLYLDVLDLAAPELTLTAQGGQAAGGDPRVNFRARLTDVGLLVSDLSGAFSASGSAILTGDAYRLEVSGSGPGGLTTEVAGSIAATGDRANLTLRGLAPLALANAFTGNNRLDGTARYDLVLNGPLQLSALSGSVGSSDARLSLPGLKIALDPIEASVRLSGGRARVEASAAVSSGGRLELAGPVTLQAPFNGELAVRLSEVGLTDPSLYDTRISGQLTAMGPLAGGARIEGRLSTDSVEIRIPSSGFGVAGALEGLQQVNEPAEVRATRARAGTIETARSQVSVAYPLNVVLDVPNRVFIRGRGLDAELGGSLRLTGTTVEVVPVGALTLIRGRLQLLGNRLDLTEASATLQGDFNPHIDVTAQTQVDDVAILIRLAGTATGPEVTFASSPDLPEDEILARLIFGRAVADISPLQALKLANGVATLTGRTGSGIIGNLRQGFGLSDLDVGTNDDGALAVRAGAYISENIYTGVEVGADGQAEVNINLDLTRNLTARGSVATDGEGTLGIYFEKDY